MMKIKDFAEANLKYDTSTIATDQELNQEVQMLLIELGLLTAPIELSFGVRAAAALKRFQQQHGCVEPEFLGPQTAQKLVELSKIGSRAIAEAITLTARQPTVLKLRPLDSSLLASDEKYTFPTGNRLELTFFTAERQHVKVVLSQPIYNSAVWYVFSNHVEISGGEKMTLPNFPPDQKPTPSAQAKPKMVKLQIPYKSQRDNLNNPDGACNVTSIAMCLAFLGIARRRSSGQFEDELYEYALDQNLSRHDPYDLARIVQTYEAKDTFDSHAKVDAIKDWLAAGKPIVTHGYFTRFGHIVVLAGYDESGFIVHDPYGEWFASGYDRNDPTGNNEKGKFQHYSYDLIYKTCAYDGEFWVHFISK